MAGCWETVLPAASRSSRTSSTFWADSTPHGRRARDQPDLGVYTSCRVGAEAHCSPCSAGLHTHDDHWQPHLYGWGQRYHGWSFLPIRQTPLFITRWRIRSARSPPYRERQERRGRLTSTARCWSWVVEEPRPIHPTRWTYDPGANGWAVNRPFRRSPTRGAIPTDTDGTTRIWLAGGYHATGYQQPRRTVLPRKVEERQLQRQLQRLRPQPPQRPPPQ